MKQYSEHFIADEHERGNTLALWFWAEQSTVSVQVLALATVRDPDIVRFTREDANAERSRKAAERDAKILTVVNTHLAQNPKAKNVELVSVVRRDPETAPLVSRLKRETLAKKIRKLRQQIGLPPSA